MKKSFKLSAIALATIALTSFGCTDSDNESPDSPKPSDPISQDDIKVVKSALSRVDSSISGEDLSTFVKKQYDLNFEIMKNAPQNLNGKNAMISTYSIQTALGMTYAGAAGDTAAEMKSVLHFDDNVHAALNKLDQKIISQNLPAKKTEYYSIDALEVKTSNNLYFSPDFTWKSAWLDTLAQNYDAGITEMNFRKNPEGARVYINKVVENDTHNRITNLIPEGTITEDTKFVLTNAIYLKAPWAGDFYHGTNFEFKKLDNTKLSVDNISETAHFNYLRGDDYQAITVALREHKFQVLFIMPDSDKFETVQDQLSGEMIHTILSSLTDSKKIHLTIPCFEFKTSLGLSNTLKALGMKKAFSEEADFSAMTEEKPNTLYISEVVHQSFIAMNEDGIEAAAATAVIGEAAGSVDEPEEIVELPLDKPFFFFVYESDTSTPLFFGRLLDPSAK